MAHSERKKPRTISKISLYLRKVSNPFFSFVVAGGKREGEKNCGREGERETEWKKTVPTNNNIAHLETINNF